MPVVYELDKEHSTIRTECVGDITLEDVLQHFQEVYGEISTLERLDALLDLRKTVGIADSTKLRQVASQLTAMEVGVNLGVLAIIADSDEFFAIGRMFEVFTESSFSAVHVFREPEEAEAWLAAAKGKAW